MFEFKLPDPGEGLEEAEIINWLVSVGDEVRVNDTLLEVETAKSLVELPSPVSGRVHALLAEPGQTVAVGTVIIQIDDGSGEPLESAAPSGTGSAEEAFLVGSGPMAESTHRSSRRSRRRRGGDVPADRSGGKAPGATLDQSAGQTLSAPADQPTPAPAPSAESRAGSAVAAGESSPGRSSAGPLTTAVGKVLAKPMVRRLARDLGVDLSGITPTGPKGSVSQADVEAAYAATHGGFAGGSGETRTPIRGVRKVTAQNVAASVAKHVHVTEFNTIDITATMDFVEALRSRREFRDQHVSPLLMYAKAVCLALGRHPDLNASWDGEAGQIVHHEHVNLGIAAATPRGLMVPVIREAETMDLLTLCRAINDIVRTAREGRLQPADYSSGTFTITNVGVFGVDTGTPIINGDESAILAMGAIKRRPWVVGSGAEERIEPRSVTTLALSFDHQLIDGEEGSQFLADLSLILSDPRHGLLF